MYNLWDNKLNASSVWNQELKIKIFYSFECEFSLRCKWFNVIELSKHVNITFKKFLTIIQELFMVLTGKLALPESISFPMLLLCRPHWHKSLTKQCQNERKRWQSWPPRWTGLHMKWCMSRNSCRRQWLRCIRKRRI